MKITHITENKNARMTHFKLHTQKALDMLCLMCLNAGFKPVLFTHMDFTLNKGKQTLYVNLNTGTAKLIKIIHKKNLRFEIERV